MLLGAGKNAGNKVAGRRFGVEEIARSQVTADFCRIPAALSGENRKLEIWGLKEQQKNGVRFASTA